MQKIPKYDLPQPASTVPVAVSSPAVKAIERLGKTTPAPSSIANAPDSCVSNDTPVSVNIDSCDAPAVPKARLSSTIH
jgi:hypothetical protein